CCLDIGKKGRSLHAVLPLIPDRVLEIPADKQIHWILGLLFTVCLLAVIKTGRDRFAVGLIATRLLEGATFHQEGGIGKDSILSGWRVVCCDYPQTSVRDSHDQSRSISLLGSFVFCKLRNHRLFGLVLRSSSAVGFSSCSSSSSSGVDDLSIAHISVGFDFCDLPFQKKSPDRVWVTVLSHQHSAGLTTST